MAANRLHVKQIRKYDFNKIIPTKARRNLIREEEECKIFKGLRFIF